MLCRILIETGGDQRRSRDYRDCVDYYGTDILVMCAVSETSRDIGDYSDFGDQ